MPFGFADRGIRCRQCGHFLNMFSPAVPQMPDPFAVTCPYCGHSALYAKSQIVSDMPGGGRWAPILLMVIAAIMILGLIATRMH